MKASSLLSTLVVLALLVAFASGTRYTVTFQGLVGRLCGSGAPSGCPDPSPCYVSPTNSAFPSQFPGTSASPNPSTSFGQTISASPSAGGEFTSSPSVSASTGQTPTASPTAGFGGQCPTPSSCPAVPSSCAPCICETPSSFPSFTRTPTSSPSPSLSGSNAASTSPTRSISPSITASPSPNPCGPQYEASTTNSFGVGMLFDRTGWARDDNNPAVFGALYAINEINAAGGIRIGSRNISLNPIFYDTRGYINSTVEGANMLTRASCVSVMIGTEDSSSRRAVQSNVLDSNAPSNAAPGLLLNPRNWEGIDVNPGVVNFGNNLLTNLRASLVWALANNKTHIHLLGSDDFDSRIFNSYARQYISSTYPQITIIGEDYIPMGTSEFTAERAFLAPLFIGASLFNNAVGRPCPNNTACTLCLSTVFGQAANRVLYGALAARYLTPNNPNIPYQVLALRATEYEILNYTNTNQNNQVFGVNYLDQIDTVQSASLGAWKSAITTFVRGAAIINDTRGYNLTTGVELRAYNAIRLWANAVAAAGTANPSVIRTAILNATFNAPNGLISVNSNRVALAGTGATNFYIARTNNPPLRGLVVTPVYNTTQQFELYPPASGNLTTADSYSGLVSGIRNYYLTSQPTAILNVSLGWNYPAIPAPTSK
eukprot:TRINITY_DN121_c0_g1_i2.p1 TRINITY_DN121_c0_g1~~TRINITY_DN121_c0_g1_i2.p1  ORF type:complete len:657 (+),score=172.02 TRINITY_DN121_c0_g1_i2:78-2048(+)